MQRESWKVFLACAIGAGLGSLVALEVHQCLWWIGLIVGGLTGYLSYEWRAVLRAIPQAYRAARDWRPHPDYWQFVGKSTVLWFVIALWIFPLLMMSTPHVLGFLDILVVLLTMCTTMTTLTMTMLLFLPKYIRSSSTTKPNVREMLYYSPPVVLFWHLPRGIWWVARRLPRATITAAAGIASGAVSFVRFCRRLSWELFLRIHSEMRLLCGVDAMLGAMVGYFAGSAVIGAAAGGLFGVLNHAVVTERWLKRRGYLLIRS